MHRASWRRTTSKITDINVRKAIAYAYPYEGIWLAIGEVPGVTRVPANSIMPPGMAGKREYFADGEQFTFNPDKSKELLAEAGYEPGEFEITMIYYEVDPLAVAGQKQFEEGLRGGRLQGHGHPDPGLDPYNIWPTRTTRSTRRSTCVASTGAPTGRRV